MQNSAFHFVRKRTSIVLLFYTFSQTNNAASPLISLVFRILTKHGTGFIAHSEKQLNAEVLSKNFLQENY
jgi:hypothetical protein